MRVVLYLRVSTEEQANHGVSLDAQLAKLHLFAALHELEVIEVVKDAAQSGKSLNRPGLQHALNLLKKRKADGLVITKLDRLSRSVADWNRLIDGYFGDRAGCQLFSVGDSIDTRTAAGRLVLNVLMSVSQWEREAIGERTKDAMAHKRRNGERVSRHVPFGWTILPDGKTLQQDFTEQATLTEIQRLRDAGHSLRRIAELLNQRGIPAKGGKAWRHSSIQSILQRAAA